MVIYFIKKWLYSIDTIHNPRIQTLGDFQPTCAESHNHCVLREFTDS